MNSLFSELFRNFGGVFLEVFGTGLFREVVGGYLGSRWEVFGGYSGGFLGKKSGQLL